MADPTGSYAVRISGLWGRVHEVSDASGPAPQAIGRLSIHRGRWGVVRTARWSPERGEVLELRRDPGLLRGQFSLWTEAREWLGSSLRWSLLRREIVLHTGSRPLRLVPLPGFRCGWALQAPKTGEMARILVAPLARQGRIEVCRKLDFELVLFAYFLASQVALEGFWPGPPPQPAAEVASPVRPAGS